MANRPYDWPMATPRFDGLRVLALESRRATEVATLISTYSGQPLVAPALREVPLKSNTNALEFAAALATQLTTRKLKKA